MKVTSLIFISLVSIATVNACTDVNATAGAGGVCFCNPGYYGTSTDVTAGGSCQECPLGTNFVQATVSGTTISSCICNDKNTVLNSGNTACQCKANFYGTANNAAGVASGCTAYPTYATSPAGSTVLASCTCPYTNAVLNAGNTACQCKANFYGTPTTSGVGGCTACQTNATSAADSTTLVSCTCPDINAALNAGNTACQCKANFYGTPTTNGASGCTTCPTGTNSSAGTTSIASCACPDTNASLNTATPPVCQCNANFYGTPTTSGANGCTACAQGQTAPAGSTTNVCKAASTSSTYILPIVSLVFSLVMLI
ncbi:hypothetical protein ABPG74_016223 [Tetrahymena malaccensis]